MLYKIIWLSLMLTLMPEAHSFIITNNSSFLLVVFLQEGSFASNKLGQILHIGYEEDRKFTINENTPMTISIMQISISQELNKPIIHSLYTKTAIFDNKTNIICNDTNVTESIYRKIVRITY